MRTDPVQLEILMKQCRSNNCTAVSTFDPSLEATLKSCIEKASGVIPATATSEALLRESAGQGKASWNMERFFCAATSISTTSWTMPPNA